MSAATPKIADYPFTTLTPNLGVVELSPNERFVLADVPGLIEGASDGAGLGARFLGHLERTAVLIHLVDATADDPVEAWRTIRGELEAYGEGLEDKASELLALNKADALDPYTRKAKVKALKKTASMASRLLVLQRLPAKASASLLRAAFGKRARARRESREEVAEEGGMAPMTGLAQAALIVVKVGSSIPAWPDRHGRQRHRSTTIPSPPTLPTPACAGAVRPATSGPRPVARSPSAAAGWASRRAL